MKKLLVAIVAVAVIAMAPVASALNCYIASFYKSGDYVYAHISGTSSSYPTIPSGYTNLNTGSSWYVGELYWWKGTIQQPSNDGYDTYYVGSGSGWDTVTVYAYSVDSDLSYATVYEAGGVYIWNG